MAANERKSSIGLQRLVMWPLEEDTAEKLEYGVVYPFTKSLMTLTRTPSQVAADQSADDQVVEDVTINTGGQLSIGLTETNTEDGNFLYGNKIKGRTAVYNKDDLSPYLAVAYMTRRRDKLVNLYKVFKTSFAEQAQTKNTMQKGQVNFDAVTIQGNYIATINNGDFVAEAKGIDPEADKDAIEQWFTDANYTIE